MKHLQDGFRILTAASMKMAVFWIVAPCRLVEVTHRADGGGSKHLSDIGKLLHYTVQPPRRQPSSYLDIFGDV
jgi:hypothetical protein